MIDGQNHPGRAHDRGGDGGGERAPEAAAGLIAGLQQDTLTAEFLRPAYDAVDGAWHALETARALVGVVVVVGVLVLAGAKLERWLQKRQLHVLDGATAGDVDLTQEHHGDRR